jgi:hypothetical protein
MVFPTSSWPHIEPFSVDVLALGLGAGGRASFFAFSPSFAMNVSQIYDGDGEPVEMKIDLDKAAN